MSCRKYENILSDYIDGAISNSEREILESHLKQCPECRKKLELLQNYKRISSSFGQVDPPESIRENVWRSISEDDTLKPGESEGKVILLNRKWIIVAASILAFAIIIPSLTRSNEITVSFDFKPVISGKGPKGDALKEESDSRVLAMINLAEKLECKVKNVYLNPDGITDGIIIKVPKATYGSFRENFNGFNTSETLPEMSFRSDLGSIMVQVYFSGRKLFTGDFNSDGRVDMGAYFNQGRNRGKFYVSYNDGRNGFLPPVINKIHDTLKFVSRSDEILGGDFNDDGACDLLLRFSNVPGDDKWILYLNNKRDGFEKGIECILRSPAERAEDQYPFTGDFNGDGFADIGIHYFAGENAGKFLVFYNRKDMSFSGPDEFITGHTGLPSTGKYTPVVMDINDDRYSDIVLYWQEGEKNAIWSVSENNRSGSGAGEYKAMFNEKGTLAFWGDYLPFSGDMDGDGFDDLLVKIGTSDEVSNWYLMINDHDGSFSTAGHFIDFNGEIDLVIR